MKNTLVIGAHGHVGVQLVEKLGQDNHQVFAGVRSEKQFDEYADMKNVNPVLFDLTALPEEMAEVYRQRAIDEVVFSAGSGGATGDDQTLIIDLDGAIKSMEAAKIAGVKRYVMVSAMGADDRKFWPESGLHGYYIAKHYADEHLRHSDLDFTIVRPSALTNDAETSKVDVVEKRGSDMSIPRADVANFVMNVLDHDDSINKVYEITAGDHDIVDAFEN
ncbi:SDR family oxidoreductase [Apilactobacillus bombintestini]|uniref:SDR family oxidoreductase n=1 Tax=Apilactobacillus bombintestini TaxID=2419772 RepID=A0A387AS44_9LACO|nr:SDR family oxidoreductase [Apilactobacillus bombintestini]AYF92201.1 SDR family oxidoreductase [Apilactobacillus bombintestini]